MVVDKVTEDVEGLVDKEVALVLVVDKASKVVVEDMAQMPEVVEVAVVVVVEVEVVVEDMEVVEDKAVGKVMDKISDKQNIMMFVDNYNLDWDQEKLPDIAE